MAISAQTSALVAGGMRAPATNAAPPVAVRILRGVLLGGARTEPGTVLQLDPLLAAQLINAGKARRADPAEAQQAHRAATTPKPAPARPAPAKETPHAQ